MIWAVPMAAMLWYALFVWPFGLSLLAKYHRSATAKLIVIHP